MRTTCVMLSVAVCLTSGMSARPRQAQDPSTNTGRRTVWDGVYTDAQAARGRTRYQAICSSCHQDGPRRDEAFMRDWSGTDVESLFRRIKASMPPGAPSSLSDAEYVDIVAYMLRVNTFPASALSSSRPAGNSRVPTAQRLPAARSVQGPQGGSQRVPDQRSRRRPHQRHCGADARAGLQGPSRSAPTVKTPGPGGSPPPSGAS